MEERFPIFKYLAESIKYVIKIYQNLPLGDLGDVVHSLARIVPNSCILIGKARQHGGDNHFEVTGKFWPEGNGGGRGWCVPRSDNEGG